ncbi:MAG TPA: tetratricopeptide repeat protein [Alphaproteobacteria bacterium]
MTPRRRRPGLLGIVLAASALSLAPLAHAWAQAPAPQPPAAPAAAPAAVPAPAPQILKPVVINPEDLQFINAEAQFRAHNYYPAYLQLLPLAHRGDARAAYLVGVMADNGLGPVQLDPKDAAQWYRAAAEKNHPDAQFALANAYSIGRGVPVDPRQAVNWITRSAGNGNIDAMLALVGMHQIGITVPRDPAQAAAWTRRAAESGSVQALYLYAVRVQTGDGVPTNEQEALAWFQRAAMRGHPAAQLVLGSAVGDGLNTPSEQNVDALMWLTLAGQRGQGEIQTTAAQLRRTLQANMMPSDVIEATRRARAWKPWAQFAGLKPDPAFDLPGGLNNPTPPKPAAAAGNAPANRGAPAAGGRGG